MGVLLSSVAKTLVIQGTQSNMRTTGLGVTSSGDSVITQSSADNILSIALNGTTTGINLFKSASSAAARSEIGAGVGLTWEAKSANFTAADAKGYSVDSTSGNVTITFPAAGVGKAFVVKKDVAANQLLCARAGSDTINGSASNFIMETAGENWRFEVDASGTNWVVLG